jgi:hypothetical protein
VCHHCFAGNIHVFYFPLFECVHTAGSQSSSRGLCNTVP